MDSTPPRRLTPPPRLLVPLPTPPISPTPSSPSPARGAGYRATSATAGFSDLAVCDPLSRRHLLLPPIPEDLLTAFPEKRTLETVTILAPIGDGEDETSFKVICCADCETNLVAFVFSSLTGQWGIPASPSWSSLGTTSRKFSWLGCRGLSCFKYMHGSLYSASPWMDKLLVLDTRTMEFSTINDGTGYHMQLRLLPGQSDEFLSLNDMPRRKRPGQNRSLPRIVGREGALEMFSLVGDHSPNGSFDLYHTSQQINREHSEEWQLENIIPLPGQYDYFTLGAAEGFLFLGATTEDQMDIDEDPVWLSMTDWDVDYFSLDIRTSELAKVCRRRRRFFHYEDVHWYFGFPPSLSSPSI
ncbi:uncharacterized protein [Lolium perenne]|uniref:uncharacterized protein n=1 Tax=Lolium perenne TaxID=4522 RepID=UPI0021EB312B|nr:uncharacterized protein LOC127308543 [Lolium perenne]